jgi:DNA replication and repair protein RecF
MLRFSITEIFLQNIRCFDSWRTQIEDGKSILILGENGVGKTSILEGISLIQGRSLRGAQYQDITNNKANEASWIASINVFNGFYNNKLSAQYKNNKKLVGINGKVARKFSSILEYIRIFHVTQNDYHNFLISSSYRRRFLDKLIIQVVPNYYELLTQYQYFSLERNKVLLQPINKATNVWLDEIEKKLVNLNLEISEIRARVVSDFNNLVKSTITAAQVWKFQPQIKIYGLLESSNFSEVDLTSFFRENRDLHRKIKRSNIGINLTKVDLIDNFQSLGIEFFSSGEQRLFLSKFIIDFIRIQVERNEFKPIILLDDILTFFDAKNQQIMIDELLSLDCQFFITANFVDYPEQEKLQILRIYR